MTQETTRIDVDGVPVFYGTCPGPAIGELIFRIGVCDEDLMRRGITHLTEHLALARLDHRTREFNGSVGPSITSFTVRGTAQEVCRHLSEVAAAIGRLPLDRARHESNILLAEAAQHGTSNVGRAMLLRFGPQSFGLIEYEELFLLQPDPDAIGEWAASHLQRGNAVVALSCPPTVDLRLDALGDGPRRDVVPAVPLPVRYPAWDRVPSQCVGAVTTTERAVVAPIATWVLGERLHHRLREQLGLSYDAGSSYDPWAADLALHTLWADCRPQDGEAVADWMRTELTRLMIDGATPEELANFLERQERAKAEPYYAFDLASLAAVDHLFGNAYRASDEFLAEQRAVTGDDVAAFIDVVQKNMMWLVPNETSLRDWRPTLVEQWSQHMVSGREFVAIDTDDPSRLLIGAEGVSLTDGGERRITVLWSRLAACKRWADGSRTLFGADSFTLTINPALWRDRDDLIVDIDTNVAPHLVATTTDSWA